MPWTSPPSEDTETLAGRARAKAMAGTARQSPGWPVGVKLASGRRRDAKKLVVRSGAFAIFAGVHRFWCAGKWFYPAERTTTQRKQLDKLQEELA
jgi:hypothetical protein